MWKLRRLTNLWTSAACYRDSFTFSLTFYFKINFIVTRCTTFSINKALTTDSRPYNDNIGCDRNADTKTHDKAWIPNFGLHLFNALVVEKQCSNLIEFIFISQSTFLFGNNLKVAKFRFVLLQRKQNENFH